LIDYSKNIVKEQTISLLELANDMGLKRYQEYFQRRIINQTENRAVLQQLEG
jgi:glucose-6-phosphate isomerase